MLSALSQRIPTMHGDSPRRTSVRSPGPTSCELSMRQRPRCLYLVLTRRDIFTVTMDWSAVRFCRAALVDWQRCFRGGGDQWRCAFERRGLRRATHAAAFECFFNTHIKGAPPHKRAIQPFRR